MNMPAYIHVKPDDVLPALSDQTPFKAIVLVTVAVTKEWRDHVSHWLVNNGCLYMMAWGIECSLWDDSVDTANLEKYDWNIPENKHVVTTWHDQEGLREVFCFAKRSAVHSHVDIKRIIIFDVRDEPRENYILERYADAIRHDD